MLLSASAIWDDKYLTCCFLFPSIFLHPNVRNYMRCVSRLFIGGNNGNEYYTYEVVLFTSTTAVKDYHFSN